jgi:hypothetical protein
LLNPWKEGARILRDLPGSNTGEAINVTSEWIELATRPDEFIAMWPLSESGS